MTEAVPKLVVRTYAPRRRWVIAAALALLGALALYITYEYGRYDGGYDRLTVSQHEAEYEVNLERLEKGNRELRVKLAQFETTEVGQSRERAEVSKTIGELQAQVALQAQELAFYKGIVQQGANSADVKIQQIRIAGTDQPRRYRLSLTLVQPGRPDGVVSGTVTAHIEGEQGGGPATLDLAAVTEAKSRELPYSFRYFENIDPDVTLPEGFVPARVVFEVRSAKKGVAPLSQAVLWNLER